MREARSTAGVTQAEIASTLGTTVSRVSRVERGAELFSVERVSQLAKLLRVPLERALAATLQDLLERDELDYKVDVSKKASQKVHVGEALRQLREKQGVGLREFADMYQSAPSRIVKMETSDVLLRPISVWYYADALGVDPKPYVCMVLQDLLQRQCGKKFNVTLK
jgi:transcriptional regulator with XRE-family HTH domain